MFQFVQFAQVRYSFCVCYTVTFHVLHDTLLRVSLAVCYAVICFALIMLCYIVVSLCVCNVMLSCVSL